MRIFGSDILPGLDLLSSIFNPEPAAPTKPNSLDDVFKIFGGGAPDPNYPVEDYSGVMHLDQGSQNSCGTTSLAMALNFLGGSNDYNTGMIDGEIRRMNSFGTAPSDLVKYAREHGFEAGMYNNSSIDELKQHLAEGHAVQVAIDDPYGEGGSGPFNTKDHYVLVTGFVKGADAKEYVKIRDPNGDDNPNAGRWTGDKTENGDYLMPVDVFQQKWGHTPDGYNNFMIAYAKGGTDLPPDRLDGVEHSIDIANVYWNTVNDFDRVIHPDNVGSFVHGVVGVVGGAPFIVPTAVGWAFSYLGDNLRDWAKGLPPGLRNIGMAAGDVLSIPGNFLTTIGSSMSEAADDFGGAFDKLLNGDIGGAFGSAVAGVGDVAGGVVDAVGGAISDGVKAVEDFFGF